MSYSECVQYEIEKTARMLQLCAKFTFTKKIKLGITHDEFLILDTLINNPNISQSDLSKMVLKGRSHTSKIIVSLEKKQYLTRSQSTKNGKMIYNMTVTNNGLELYNKAMQVLKNEIEVWNKNIGDSSSLKEELKKIQNFIIENVGDISLE